MLDQTETSFFLVHEHAAAARRRPDARTGSTLADIDIDRLRQTIERRLAASLRTTGPCPERLTAAMRHALLAPGKRLRPLLTVLAACGEGRWHSAAVEAGCAIEMVHTASLVLDDLPAMDDAELRRGLPTTHRAFGEATAILAAIALLSRGFGMLATLDGVDPAVRSRLVAVLSEAVGTCGLVAGQAFDLARCEHPLDATHVDASCLDEVNRLKTGALFIACVEIGGRIARVGDTKLLALRTFADNLGLAFQTLDDILDATRSSAEIGKDVGKDGGKNTLVDVAGLARARHVLAGHVEEARAALVQCDFEHDGLFEVLDHAFPDVAR